MTASSSDVYLEKAKWLADICAAEDYNENQTLSELLHHGNENFKGMPHSVRREIMNQHFGKRRINRAISREIGRWVGRGPYGANEAKSYGGWDDVHQRYRNDIEGPCYFYHDPLRADVAFLRDFTGANKYPVRLIFEAYKNACHCETGCKLSTNYVIERVLEEVVTSEMEHGNTSGDWSRVLSLGDRIYEFIDDEAVDNIFSTRDGKSGNSDREGDDGGAEDEQEEESHEVIVLFTEVMAKLTSWHSARTGPLLAYKVAGHRLPQELVDMIAEFYTEGIEAQLSAEKALVDEVFAKQVQD